MYCSRCGKKIADTMLFCPFCGAPVVIPEQDDDPADSAPVKSAGQAEPSAAPEEQTNDAAGPVDDDSENHDADTTAALRNDALASAGDDASEDFGDDAAAELLDWTRSRQSAVDEWARPLEMNEPFSPLHLEEAQEPEQDWREEISRKKQSVTLEKKPPEMRGTESEPVRLEGNAPKLVAREEKEQGDGEPRPGHRHANTLVPPKTMDPNDIFMDAKSPSYDEYDAYDDVGAEEFAPERFAFEDEEEGSFFMRHLRGFVSLALFVILILLFVIYAFSKAGQIGLAKANLAWSTEAYSQLGYQSYQESKYAEAGLYYERALQRDDDNYSYASSAAMAYFEAGDKEKAAAMLKRCVEINPNLLEPYIYLLKVYPDAAQRPWDVTQLLQKGYQLTGDSRLNVTG